MWVYGLESTRNFSPDFTIITSLIEAYKTSVIILSNTPIKRVNNQKSLESFSMDKIIHTILHSVDVVLGNVLLIFTCSLNRKRQNIPPNSVFEMCHDGISQAQLCRDVKACSAHLIHSIEVCSVENEFLDAVYMMSFCSQV